MVWCCVPNCRNRTERNNVRCYRIPAERHFAHRTDLNELSRLRRRKWLEAINRPHFTEKAINHSHVCSEHFVAGKPAELTDPLDVDWIPTLKMKIPKSQYRHHQTRQTCKRQQRMPEDYHATRKKYSYICRACLGEITNPIYDLTKVLFEDITEQRLEKISILQALLTVTSMPIPLRLDYPQYICATCMGTLQMAYRFMIQFKESQEKLERKLIKKCVVDAKNIEGVSIAKIDSRLKRGEVEFIFDEEDMDMSDTGSDEIDEKWATYKSFFSEPRLEKKMEDCPALGDDVTILSEDEIKFELEECDASAYSGIVEYSSEETAPAQSKSLQELKLEEDTNHEPVVSGSHDHTYYEQESFDCSEEQKTNYEVVIEQSEEKATCNVCRLEFPSELEMFRHRQKIHNYYDKTFCKTFICKYCKRYFTSNRDLTDHMEKDHSREYFCDKCGQSFYAKSRLISHMKVHADKRNFPCSVCRRRFLDQNSLDRHKNIHLDKKRFQCAYCAKMFKTAANVTIHERIHTGDKPYLCRFCPKQLISISRLTTHEKYHTGYRPFLCKFCQKGFREKTLLKVHILRHPGPHKCDFCKRSFIEEALLLLHYKRSHADLMPDIDLSDWKLSDYYVRLTDKVSYSPSEVLTLAGTHHKSES